MTMFVKICGITTEAAVDAAVTAGTNAIGFVFHAPSPRDIEPKRAALLARRLPAGVSCVAVTRHPTQALVDRVLAEFMPDAWQSDAADFDSLHLPHGIARWSALRAFVTLPPGSRRVLFESPASGSGGRADWSMASVMARTSELILCGGLDAGNVGGAIAAVRPFGVDVSSGVESARGIKDPRRIREFIVAARMGQSALRA